MEIEFTHVDWADMKDLQTALTREQLDILTMDIPVGYVFGLVL